MPGRFDISPDALSRAAGAFTALADELAASRAQLVHSLDSTGGMAGGDGPGAAFSGFYDPRARLVESNLDRLVEGLTAIADGLAGMAHNYGAVDVAASLHTVAGRAP